MSAVNAKAAESGNLSETGIERLIAGLDSVSEGELGISMLVAFGEHAVPSLRRFPLHGQRVTAQRGESA